MTNENDEDKVKKFTSKIIEMDKQNFSGIINITISTNSNVDLCTILEQCENTNCFLGRTFDKEMEQSDIQLSLIL